MRDGEVLAVGEDREVMPLAGPGTRVIDLRGRAAIPGLNDSHTHLIRGGLNYNLELRWDGVRSLADAMAMLQGAGRAHAARRNGCAWSAASPSTSSPRSACRRWRRSTPPRRTRRCSSCTCTTARCSTAPRCAPWATPGTRPNPPGGQIERDAHGNPTGLLLAQAERAASSTRRWRKGPKLPPEYQVNSTRHFMRELNRLGITSVIDAGGGFQNYPDDYEVIAASCTRAAS